MDRLIYFLSWFAHQLIEKDPEKRRLMASIERGVEALGAALTTYQQGTWEKYTDVWEVDKDNYIRSFQFAWNILFNASGMTKICLGV